MSHPPVFAQRHLTSTGRKHGPQTPAARIPPAQNNPRSPLLRYGVALASAAMAVLLREVVTPLWGHQLPFLTLFPAVFLSAWYGGLGPGLVTTALCALAAAYLWPAPLYSLAGYTLADQVGLVFAVLVMSLITWLTAALRRTQETLEYRVRERTAELTQTNVALHNERARLMTILEHLPVGVVFSDAATGKTLLANPRAKQIWHYETPPDSCAPEFARSQGFFPDGRPYRVEDWPMQRALKNGETTTEEEIAFIHGDGTRGVMQASAAPIHDPEGRVTAAVLTFADITARKRLEQELRALNAELEQRVREQTAALQQHNEELEIAEEELRQQTEELLAARAHAEQERRRYQALFEFAPDGYLITDREGIILEANEAALVLLRVPPNFLPGKPLRVFIAQAETKEFHARLTHLLQTEKTEEWELSVQPRSGAAFAAGLRVAPVIDANGKVMTLRWLLRDITARKEAEEALARHARDLARANADLRQIAYVAAHDLQEPVRQVGVYTQKIAARYQDSLDAATREAADFLVEGSRRMIAQLNDLMHYLEVDEAATERVITNCEVVFQRALAHIHEAIAANDATITHDPLPTVEAHPAHLQLVFQELLDNAVKFRTAAPPQVHVWAEREAHGWRFAVRDHGISIDPQYYGRLFGLFKRLERDRYPGTGMGLAICKKIVERHGGGIWLEPTSGGGVTVIFTISDKEK